MGFFDSPETKTKQKTTQKPSDYGQALQTLLARYLLMRLQTLPGMTFGQFRQGGMPQMPLDIMPGEAKSLPGVMDAPAGVNPILLNRSRVKKGG